MQQHHCRPLPADADIKLRAVGLDGLGLERSRKRLDGESRRGKQQRGQRTEDKTDHQHILLKTIQRQAYADKSRRRPA